MGEDSLEARLRTAETEIAVLRTVWDERYKSITWRLNVAVAGIGLLLGAVVAGDPVLAQIGRIVGGH